MVRAETNQNAFRLRPSSILRLNRVAIEGLNEFAGLYRPSEMKIGNSRHRPPTPDLVPRMVEDMCDYVTDNRSSKSPIHLAAYLLWRINWIHPFDDGNGRTARAASYAVLSLLLGYELPGSFTIPEYIARDKEPYYKALEAADEAYQRNLIDVSELEALLERALAEQLRDIQRRASGNPVTPPKE